MPERFDFAENVIIVESLKKRRRGIFRAVPIPKSLLEELDRAHVLRCRQHTPAAATERIWPWCRTTAWKYVKRAMADAHVSRSGATSKGLRHSFAVTTLQANVPLSMVQKWLGHARIATTAIYANAVSDEERMIAERFWRTFE